MLDLSRQPFYHVSDYHLASVSHDLKRHCVLFSSAPIVSELTLTAGWRGREGGDPGRRPVGLCATSRIATRVSEVSVQLFAFSALHNRLGKNATHFLRTNAAYDQILAMTCITDLRAVFQALRVISISRPSRYPSRASRRFR